MMDNWDIIVLLNLDSFRPKGERLPYIGHLKLDDIPATADTWHLTGHVLKVN
jgi:hypothetical protein